MSKDFLNDMFAQAKRQAPETMATEIELLKHKVAALEAQNLRFVDNFKKVNSLLKECIARIEG